MLSNLPKNWKLLPFEKVLSEPLRNGIYKKKEFHGRGTKIVNMGELFSHPRLKNGVDMKRVELNERELDKATLLKGDLIFARRSLTAEGAGKCSIILSEDEPLTFESSIIRARLNRKLANPEYFYYLFNSPFGKWLLGTILRQVAVAGITGSDLAKLEVPVPPIDIQNQIASTGCLIDDFIEVNSQTNQTLETIAQTLFKSWFVDFDPVKAKLSVLAAGGSAEEAERAAMCAISARDEASLNTLQTEQPEAYAELARTAALFPSAMQDSELGEIPVGWEVGILGDNYNVVMGQSPKGDTYNEVKEGQLFFQGRAEFGWRYPTPRLYTSSPKRVASKGDILMSVRAPVGDLNIALEDCCIGRGLSALRHNSGSTSFTYYQLKSLQTQLDRFNGEGTVFGSINQKDLKGLQVINPCSISIEAFNRFSLSLDKEIESRAIESIRLSELRDTLLPKLLSGELTLPDKTPSQTNPPENAMLKKQPLTMGVA